MKKTYRMIRGILSYSIIVTAILTWLVYTTVYTKIKQQPLFSTLPTVSSNIFLMIALSVFIINIISWCYRNKIWYGLSFSLNHYNMILNIRKQIKQARFETINNFESKYVHIPKIIIQFDDNGKRETGFIKIRNSIKFDKQLEQVRLDGALKRCIIERRFLSQDRNWYIFEFYRIDLFTQENFHSKSDYVEWSSKETDAYHLRLDNRSTIPLHHIGLSGQTGSGKTFFLEMLCIQILNKKIEHTLYIIDPKKADLFHIFKETRATVVDRNKSLETISLFHSKMIERQTALQSFFLNNHNKTYKDANLPAIILLVDEFGSLRESWKLLSKKERDETESKLADIAFIGRQLGCFLWISTQQLNAQTLPTSIREQLVIKIVLGASDEQTYRTLFSSSVEIPLLDLKAGQGLISCPSIATVDHPKMVNIPYCNFLDT